MNSIDEDIRSGQYANVYLLYGPEDFLRKLNTKKLVRALVPEGDTMNFVSYDGEKPEIGPLIDLAETLPFFADRRVILIKDSGFFKSGAKDLAEYLKEPCSTTCFIFSEKDVDKRSSMYQTVQKKGRVLEHTTPEPAQLARWIGSYLGRAGKKIRSSTANLILDRCGSDMNQLSRELEKLISYVGDRDVVENEDVAAVCTVEVTGQVYKMIDAIADRKPKVALDLYYDLLKIQEKPLGILSKIANQYNRMLQAKEMSQGGRDRAFVRSCLGLTSDYVAGLYINRASRYSRRFLQGAVEECVRLEEAAKTGRMDKALCVELLIVKLTG